MFTAVPLDTTARIIQLSLTPVFLLSGIAALLNVFSTRLGRVADQVDDASVKVLAADPVEVALLTHRLGVLRRRSLYLDAAVVLATIGSVSTGLAILTLFVGALQETAAGLVLFAFFGFAVACTLFALGAFLAEALLAGRGLRIQVEVQRRDAAQK